MPVCGRRHDHPHGAPGHGEQRQRQRPLSAGAGQALMTISKCGVPNPSSSPPPHPAGHQSLGPALHEGGVPNPKDPRVTTITHMWAKFPIIFLILFNSPSLKYVICPFMHLLPRLAASSSSWTTSLEERQTSFFPLPSSPALSDKNKKACNQQVHRVKARRFGLGQGSILMVCIGMAIGMGGWSPGTPDPGKGTKVWTWTVLYFNGLH